jgi:flavin-binding protein dodecin
MGQGETYIKTEIVGTSTDSISDAIQNAITTASQTLRNMDWFEVIDVRGALRDGTVSSYQVTLKIGFRYEKG